MANYFYLCRPANQSAACAEIGSMAAPTTDWSDVGRPRASLSLAQCIDTPWSVYRTRSVLCGQCFLLSLLPDWSLPYLLLLYICYVLADRFVWLRLWPLGMRSSTRAVFGGGERNAPAGPPGPMPGCGWAGGMPGCVIIGCCGPAGPGGYPNGCGGPAGPGL